MVAIAIFSIIGGGFLLAITAGQKTMSIGAAQVEVQSEVRRAMDWITKDVRQGRRVDIGSSGNTPTSSHIKFNMVTGYNTADPGSVTLSTKTIEYTYDSGQQTLTRSETTPGSPATVASWTFRHITQPPFYTRTASGIIEIDPLTPGADSPVFQSRNLVIQLVGQQTIQGGVTPPYTLTDEVRIRN